MSLTPETELGAAKDDGFRFAQPILRHPTHRRLESYPDGAGPGVTEETSQSRNNAILGVSEVSSGATM